jgi:DNA-binding IclR family transcriptional regulator
MGITKTLAGVNFLEKDPQSGKYRLGPMLLQLGLKYVSNTDIITIARVWMERLSLKFQLTVNAGLMVGDSVVIVFSAAPDNEFLTFPKSAIGIPMHTTCIGKVLLANLGPERLMKILESYQFIPLTENSITDKEAFLKELEKVRLEGLSFEHEETFIGMAGIGAPIYNHTGKVTAAFAITGNAEKVKAMRKELIEEMRSSSREVSRHMGYIEN